jgi:hypothetical protein
MTQITIDRALVEQLVGALERAVQISDEALTTSDDVSQRQAAITAGHVALAQPRVEPVAWAYRLRNASGWGSWAATMLGGRKPQQANWLEIEVRPLVYGDAYLQATAPRHNCL